MLYIPLPILIKAQLPLKRKIILCGVFSLGILVVRPPPPPSTKPPPAN